MKKLIVNCLIAAGVVGAVAILGEIGYQVHKTGQSAEEKYQRLDSQADQAADLVADLQAGLENASTNADPAAPASVSPSFDKTGKETSEAAVSSDEDISEAGKAKKRSYAESIEILGENSDRSGSTLQTEQMTEPRSVTSDPTAANGHRVIFVGDSRTVGMGHAESDRYDECIYIGESGEGYNWFLDYGLEQLQEALRNDPNRPVVYNLGVNDTESIDNYIALYREIEEEWDQTRFFYLSVNPITDDTLMVTKEDIIGFNERMKQEFPDTFIDSYSRMMKDGFETVDGVHYTEDTYCAIHDFALKEVDRICGVSTELSYESNAPSETEFTEDTTG